MSAHPLSIPSLALLLTVLFATTAPGGAQTTVGTAPAAPTSDMSRFDLASPFQSGPTTVRVLLPEPLIEGKRYPVLYILPVEPEGHFLYGDGMAEAKKADVANRFHVICVAPSFKVVPWYGNHATDPQIRQEDFVVKTLIPEIDRRCPTKADREHRWLLGFSKSGWGACTLWLRHGEVFGYAATWDGPFLLNGENHGKEWGPIGIKQVFGTKEAFQAALPTKWEPASAEPVKDRPRLVVGVGPDWKAHGEGMHTLLGKAGVPHVYRHDLLLKHRWDTGWFVPVLEELVKAARSTPAGG